MSNMFNVHHVRLFIIPKVVHYVRTTAYTYFCCQLYMHASVESYKLRLVWFCITVHIVSDWFIIETNQK